MERLTIFLNIFYRVWPPVTRTLEFCGFHAFRQRFILGNLASGFNKEKLKARLVLCGFERAILAWKDPGEVLSMRKVHNRIFQYHVRLFIDGEIRGHFEYSPEADPIRHFFECYFEPETDFFRKLLGEYLVTASEQRPFA